MPDVQTVEARSLTFIDQWDGTGKFSICLPDGSNLNIIVTLPQAALSLEQMAAFVARGVRILHR